MLVLSSRELCSSVAVEESHHVVFLSASVRADS